MKWGVWTLHPIVFVVIFHNVLKSWFHPPLGLAHRLASLLDVNMVSIDRGMHTSHVIIAQVKESRCCLFTLHNCSSYLSEREGLIFKVMDGSNFTIFTWFGLESIGHKSTQGSLSYYFINSSIGMGVGCWLWRIQSMWSSSSSCPPLVMMSKFHTGRGVVWYRSSSSFSFNHKGNSCSIEG